MEMNNSKKMFITGGSGFIGYYFQQYIDWETTIYDLIVPDFKYSSRHIQGDARDAEGLERALNGYEIILH